jgi:putative FmdB family regulatory protein
MPTYEYECASCGTDFDLFQSMSDAPLKVCPTCGNAVRRKINGGMGVIFKGSGFYSNDNKKSSAPRGGADKGEAAGGSSPAKAGCESCSASTAASSSGAEAAPKKDAQPKKERS